MLGASAAAFGAPFALGYALHASRGAPDRGLGRVALVLAVVETAACLVVAGGWLWNQIG